MKYYFTENAGIVYAPDGSRTAARHSRVVKNRFKTIRPYEPDWDGGCDILWNGWQSNAAELIERGWTLTIVRNHLLSTETLYVRDPVSKLMGRGRIWPHAMQEMLKQERWEAHLDYFLPERNGRIKKYVEEIEEKESVIAEESIGALLEAIAEIQRENKKPKHRSVAEILELVKIA